MPLVYDNTRPSSQGGGWIEWNGPLGDEPGGWVQELARRRQQAAEAYQRSKNRWRTFDRIATVAAAAPFAAAAAPALMSLSGIGAGGAGATSLAPIAGGAPWAVTPLAGTAAMSAPVVGGISSALSSAVPWLRLGEIGASTVGNIMATRSANTAARRAHDLELAGLRQSQANFDKQYDLEREAFNADQEQLRLDREANNEERAYARRLSEEREGRRGPYRALGRSALISLADIMRLPRPA